MTPWSPPERAGKPAINDVYTEWRYGRHISSKKVLDRFGTWRQRHA
jgi:hypothetical protein